MIPQIRQKVNRTSNKEFPTFSVVVVVFFVSWHWILAMEQRRRKKMLKNIDACISRTHKQRTEKKVKKCLCNAQSHDVTCKGKPTTIVRTSFSIRFSLLCFSCFLMWSLFSLLFDCYTFPFRSTFCRYSPLYFIIFFFCFYQVFFLFHKQFFTLVNIANSSMQNEKKTNILKTHML